jgi:hypothetical protein
MQKRQHDHRPAVQNLLHKIQTESVPAFDFASDSTFAPSSTHSFVPRSEVKAYLQNDNYYQTKELLRAIYEHEAPVSAREVAVNCPTVCCILALINKLPYVSAFAHNRDLWDDCLPFRSSENFPQDTSDSSFFQCFYKHQWRFLAEVLSDTSRGVQFRKEYILPFIGLDYKTGGHTARVYKAIVHHDYDNMVS